MLQFPDTAVVNGLYLETASSPACFSMRVF